MTGLLRKDLYYMKAYAWPYLPLLALLCLSPGAMGPAYTMALALALPRMTIANDERRWDRYAVMTPLRAELVVAEKYLLHLACIALAAACMALSFPAQNAALRLMGRTEAMWGAELNLPAYVLIQVWLTALLVTAVGTNSLAASAMLKAGADLVATGENAVVVGCRRADVILGPIGIVIADAMLGEVTPAMALAAAGALVLSFRVSVGFYRARLRGRFG